MMSTLVALIWIIYQIITVFEFTLISMANLYLSIYDEELFAEPEEGFLMINGVLVA